jgi:hypothetical protein
MKKTAIQAALDDVFKLSGEGKSMSQSAYSQSRDKFDHSPFVTMQRATIKDEYSGKYKLPQFRGYHLLSVDGSPFQLCKDPELLKEFGSFGSNPDYPTAGASILYDVLHERVLDANITRGAMNERTECKKHIEFLCEELDHIAQKSIITVDRGFPSSEMFSFLENKGLKYVIRCSSKFLSEVNNAPLGITDVTLKNGVAIRVVKFKLNEDTTEILVTNIFDMPLNAYKKIYSLRWGIETMFGKLKRTVCIEKFSGKSVNSIHQDFWASIVLFNLMADLFDEANLRIKKEDELNGNKTMHKARYCHLVVTMREQLIVALYRGDPESFNEHLAELIDLTLNTAIRVKTPIRPNRSFSRKLRKNKRINYNHKTSI